ncbi:hypothetical protein Pelo_7067 [Pelomyxa schiedti]|nr:hypothetical protein Pelo_7067 [Pelomyxa schiedti]
MVHNSLRFLSLSSCQPLRIVTAFELDLVERSLFLSRYPARLQNLRNSSTFLRDLVVSSPSRLKGVSKEILIKIELIQNSHLEDVSDDPQMSVKI